MPTILRIGPHRFFFANESEEPPHVHVKAAENQAKFWLDPVELAANYGFNARELTRIRRLVAEQRDQLLEAWNEYFP